MIAQGRHRSAELAEKHARTIERERGLETGSVFVASRRDDKGHFSSHGRNFYFDIRTEIKTLEEFLGLGDEDFEEMEIEGGVDYGTEE